MQQTAGLSSLRTVNFSETAKQGSTGDQNSCPKTPCAVTQNPASRRRPRGLRAPHTETSNKFIWPPQFHTSLCGFCLSLSKIKIIITHIFIWLSQNSALQSLLTDTCCDSCNQSNNWCICIMMCHIKHYSDVTTSHLQLRVLCVSISNRQLFHLTATKSLDIFIKRHQEIHV